MLITESWLTPDTVITLDGFQLIRADWTPESGKRKRGKLPVFVNDGWCNFGHITINDVFITILV